MSIRSDEQNIICARNRTIKDLKTQLAEKEKEIERLRGAMNIEIGDFIMVDDESQFVSAIVSDPVLRVYYWLDNEELSVTIDEIDCHFVNMNRVKEDLDQ